MNAQVTTKARVTCFDSSTGKGFVQTSIGVVPFQCLTVADLTIGEVVTVIFTGDDARWCEVDTSKL